MKVFNSNCGIQTVTVSCRKWLKWPLQWWFGSKIGLQQGWKYRLFDLELEKSNTLQGWLRPLSLLFVRGYSSYGPREGFQNSKKLFQNSYFWRFEPAAHGDRWGDILDPPIFSAKSKSLSQLNLHIVLIDLAQDRRPICRSSIDFHHVVMQGWSFEKVQKKVTRNLWHVPLKIGTCIGKSFSQRPNQESPREINLTNGYSRP